MFEHSNFDRYQFEHVPLDRDLYLMDEIWMEAYEREMMATFEGDGSDDKVGYIAYAAARRVSDDAIDLSWYPNVYDRFHEMRVYLPRDQFICCVASWQYDEKPHIFVRSNWLTNLYLRSHSVFMMVDAIGVKNAIRRDVLSRDALIGLRDRIDAIAARYPTISFISFADSLLVKSNWQVGQYDSAIRYSYEPEVFLHLFKELQATYHDALGMNIYGVLTQGSNAYYDDALLHVSRAGHHISLNSLGLPFAQLLSIDQAARSAVRGTAHDYAELYIDEAFFRSLRFELKFDRSATGHSTYREPMLGGTGVYYYTSCQHLLNNLAPPKQSQ